MLFPVLLSVLGPVDTSMSSEASIPSISYASDVSTSGSSSQTGSPEKGKRNKAFDPEVVRVLSIMLNHLKSLYFRLRTKITNWKSPGLLKIKMKIFEEEIKLLCAISKGPKVRLLCQIYKWLVRKISQSIQFRQGLWDISCPKSLVGHLHCLAGLSCGTSSASKLHNIS